MSHHTQTGIGFAFLVLLLTFGSAQAQGSAELQLESPEIDRSVTLNAHFATGIDSLRGGTEAFALYLYDESYEESADWMWIARTGGVPSTGTHRFSTLSRGGPLDDEDFTLGGELNAADSERLTMLVSTSEGLLTIRSVTEDRIEGTFQVTNLMGGTITGTFEAPRGTFHGTRGPGG
ncbi:hypothetical protein [Longimonas halophila]|nr:hypothetical protein [Longimonas halophila]